MKKWLVYILLSSFVLTSTDLVQVFRIPSLFIHFTEHKNQQAISFKSFLADHYFDKNHTDHDTDQDNTLPYKSVITSLLYIFHITVPPVITKLDIKIFSIPQITKVTGLKAFHYSSMYLASCWNPPKK